MPGCVIVGSSNAIPTTWTAEFCAAHGLTEHNHAVSGSGYTTATSFAWQLQQAGADSTLDASDVAMVVICDASNDIRANNDAGNRIDVTAGAEAAIGYARATFVNARVLVLPVVWPSAPADFAQLVPGGYQVVWNEALLATVDVLRTVAAANGAELVEQSWTWLTGHDEWMKPQQVHPNCDGYSQVAQWLGKHVRGEQTRRDSAWLAAPYIGDAHKDQNARELCVQRQGWDVTIQGGALKPTVGSWYTDLASIPSGFRPTYTVEVTARYNGAANGRVATIYPDGTLRMWEAVPAGALVLVGGSYRIG